MKFFRAAVILVGVGHLIYALSDGQAKMSWDEQVTLYGQIIKGLGSFKTAAELSFREVASHQSKMAWNFLNKWLIAPLGNLCKTIGSWLHGTVKSIGQKMIQGIQSVLVSIGNSASAGKEFIMVKLGGYGLR
jgi:hypothetical protein